MTYQYQTKYFSIEDQDGVICEGDTRAEVIDRAADYFQDLTEEAGIRDVVIHWMNEDGESCHDEDHLLTWGGYEASQYSQHNTMNKSALGVA